MFVPWFLAFLQIISGCDFLSPLLYQLTLWDGPVEDSEVGGKTFLSDGAICVDCQCQNACVGDDPSRGVLTTVPSDVRPDCKKE